MTNALQITQVTQVFTAAAQGYPPKFGQVRQY